MLWSVILTFFIVSENNLGTQVEARTAENEQSNGTQTFALGVNNVIGAETILKNNNFYSGPNTFGSVARIETSDGRTRTVIAPADSGQNGIHKARIEERNHQRNGVKNIVGSKTFMSGNNIDVGSGNKIQFGSYAEQKNQVYLFGNNQSRLSENLPLSLPFENKLISESILTNNNIDITGNMTFRIGSSAIQRDNIYIIKDDFQPKEEETQLSNDNLYLDSHTEQYNQPNSKTQVSANVFYMLTSVIIILLEHCKFWNIESYFRVE